MSYRRRMMIRPQERVADKHNTVMCGDVRWAVSTVVPLSRSLKAGVSEYDRQSTKKGAERDYFFFVVPGPQGENLCPTL